MGARRADSALMARPLFPNFFDDLFQQPSSPKLQHDSTPAGVSSPLSIAFESTIIFRRKTNQPVSLWNHSQREASNGHRRRTDSPGFYAEKSVRQGSEARGF